MRQVLGSIKKKYKNEVIKLIRIQEQKHKGYNGEVVILSL
jgi:hypothetical protein